MRASRALPRFATKPAMTLLDAAHREILGLSTSEALARRSAEGHNELPRSASRSFGRIVQRAFSEPMFLLLFAASGVYLLLGDRTEALVLIGSVVVIAAITVYQEHRTERVLDALRDLSSPRAIVVRDGARCRIPGREVVRGDVLEIREGDRVAADGLVLVAADVRVDESLLTGESVPVEKRPSPDGNSGDATHRVHAGTLVVKGHAVVRVAATGARTQMGAIGSSLEALGVGTTALQAEMRRLVRTFALAAGALCAILAAVHVATRGDWLVGVLAGLTLAMAILPEEFPVVLAVFLALGAWRLSRLRVLTRTVAAIEAIGAATVLCVDKTGTLTQNRMAVRSAWTDGAHHSVEPGMTATLPDPLLQALRLGMLASEPNPFDPMEQAFHDAAATRPDGALVRRYPMSPERLMVAHAWQVDGSDRMTVAAKGAPETIVGACGLSPQTAEVALAAATHMARAGLRVLAVAHASCAEPLPDDPRDLALDFAGLVGLADPLRGSVPAAMRECHEAGVRVVMITGDFPETARAIAREAGIAAAPAIMTGGTLDTLSDADLRQTLDAIHVFARVTPAQKLRIVKALQSTGNTVAMTGDGVNDAPALKAADIGIAMGGRGTDVAREAAALVLLDDDFGSIVRAIRQGRRIFDNLRKALSYLVSVHMPIAALGFVPVVLGAPPMLFPMHVLFLEFIIDPACSVAFEAEPGDDDLMRRPPRNRRQPVLDRALLTLAALEGALAIGLVMGLYALATLAGKDESHVRLLAFSAVVAANLSLIFFTRAGGVRVWRHIVGGNRTLWLLALATVAVYGVVLAAPSLRTQFRLSPPTASDAAWLLAGLVAFWTALALGNLAHRAWLRPGVQPSAPTP